MSLHRSLVLYLDPRRVMLLFVSSNLLFLVVDILIAHSYNHFESTEEWIPVGYSVLAGIGLLLYAFLKDPSPFQRAVMHFVLWLGVLVGGAGFIYHFHGATFREFSLKSLVYAAPLVAPLAYIGLSFVALVTDEAFKAVGEKRRQILFLLTSGGFAGNLFLSILDHARNGFFVASEWIPVFISAFTMIVFFLAGLKKNISKQDLLAIHVAIGFAIATGIAGFIFHLMADLGSEMPLLKDRFIYGAPIFAPLLFCDIAFMGLLASVICERFESWVFIED